MGSWLFVPNQVQVPIGFLPSGSTIVRAVTPLNDGSGKVYVGGDFTSYKGVAINRIVRLNANASIDTSFNVGTGFSGLVQVIFMDTFSPGKVYVGGSFTNYNGTTSNRIIRLNSNGTVDSSFNIGNGFNNPVTCLAVALDGSGDVFVGGQFTAFDGTTRNRIARINLNGTLNGTFLPTTGANGTVSAVSAAVDGSGDIYISGSFTTYNGTGTNATRLARINSNGTLDAGFATGVGANNNVLTFVALHDGTFRIAGGGQFTQVSGTGGINRIGIVVPGGVGQGGFNSGTGCNNTVRTVVELTGVANQMIATGDFTTYNGVASNRIIKVTTNVGVVGVDSTFRSNGGTAFNASVNMSAQDINGKIYAVGDFTSYNGVLRDRLLRLNADGSIDTSFT